MDDSLQSVSIGSSVQSNNEDGDGHTPSPARQVTAGAVVSRIEDILEGILDRLIEGKELSLNFSYRKYGRRHQQQIHFPGRTILEAKKFARILLILQLSHDALVTGTVLTKRHIYYQHQELFENQRVVDELVDDLAMTLGIERDDLNIVATAKGLLSGPLTFQLHDGTVIDSSLGDVGTPLPISRSISRTNYRAIRWALVVEKDAVFQSLTSARYWQTSSLGPGLAKGYPDLITMSFLRLLHAEKPQLPIFTLVDFDPDGLNIFRCYRFGSGLLTNAADAIMTSIRLLGITAQDVLELDGFSAHDSQSSTSKTCRTSISSTSCRDPISHLSLRDRKQAVSTLDKAASALIDDEEARELRHQLQLMLMMGVKAEIQWLDEAGNITEWLDAKLGHMLSTPTL